MSPLARRIPRRSRLVPLSLVCLLGLAGGGASAAPAASAASAPGDSRVVAATPREGVRLIGDLRVGPLASASAVSTLADVRRRWGSERRLENCVASWGTGVRLLFTTFGGPLRCSARPLQQVTVLGPRWKVRVGRASYAIGAARSSLPADARFVAPYGYVLATMPFIGDRTPTVMAHVAADGRIDRFTLFIGGAGD